MAENEFQVESMGEIYALALINEAQKQNALEAITEDVRGIGELLAHNKAFLAFTQAVTISDEEQVAALDKIFTGRIHPLTLNAIKSMARRNRFMFLRGLVEAFDVLLKKMGGHVEVEITSAREIRPEVLERVKQAISKSESKIADIKVTLDPSLLGGMTVRIGDTLIDGSVATQLDKIKEQIKRGGKLKAEAVVGS
ncbi:MAG TPA: ATP synthase F1 subunit delta [Phycisphaerae bacterium]|jgi:F-type H+-transporting ATPase subunit delta|nr:ATP synthase F1 subunit delta [Phycisphaerae bacterium]